MGGLSGALGSVFCLVAWGLGGMFGGVSSGEGGSGAGLTGARGEKVSVVRLGRDPGPPGGTTPQ